MTDSTPETSIEYRLKSLLIETLGADIKPEAIDDKTPLIGSGLGLDSVVILQLISKMEKDFGFSLNDLTIGPELFRNIESLANGIREQMGKGAEVPAQKE